MKRLIHLFMWGYQQHFAWNLKKLAERVFEELGVALTPDVLLVGVLKPGEKDRHAVCVEPEDGKWELSLFPDLPVRYAETIETHPLQRTCYGDEPSMRDKPENIRRSSATMVVQDALQKFDRDQDVKSFCGTVRPVGDYYVVPVIQVPEGLFRQFPP